MHEGPRRQGDQDNLTNNLHTLDVSFWLLQRPFERRATIDGHRWATGLHLCADTVQTGLPTVLMLTDIADRVEGRMSAIQNIG